MTDLQQGPRVTVSEIAQLAGVSVSAVSNWRKRYADFPAPTEGTAAGDFFALQEVLAWLDRRGKSVRKPQEQGLQELLWLVLDSLRGEGAPNESLVLALLQVLTVWRFSASAKTSGTSSVGSTWSRLTAAPVANLEIAWRRAVDSIEVGETPAVREVLESPSITWRGVQQLVVAVDRLAVEGMRHVSSRVFGEAISLMIFQLQQSQAIRVFGSATPKSLTSLMVQLLSPISGVVYDPAAGHAMVLAEAARAAAGEPVRLVGQELSEYSWRIGVLHLALCGLTADLGRGDTLLHDAFRGHKADRIILDPPLNLRMSSTDFVFDPRWTYGTSNYADWMWAQHLVGHLSPAGIGVMVVSLGSLSRGGRDAMIRARLIEAGELDAVIALPSGIVAGTSIPVALLLFDRTRSGKRGDVLFLDARQLGLSRRGLTNELTPEAITKIGDAVRTWRSGQPVSEPTFAAVASAGEILGSSSTRRDQDSHPDLTPNRFIRYVAAVKEESTLVQLQEINSAREASGRSLADLGGLKSVVGGAAALLTASQIDWPSVRLWDVLEERPVPGGRIDPDGVYEERPFVSTSLVANCGGRLDQVPNEKTRGKRKARAARRGDVLLASRGVDGSSRRVSSATVDVDTDLAYSDSLLLLTPKADRLDPDYLRYALTSSSGIAALSALATGTTIANIRPDALMELEIRVPPLDVQRQVVTSLRAVEQASEKLASATQQVSELFSLLRNGAAAGLLAPAAPDDTNESTEELKASRNPLTHPIGIYVEGGEAAPRGHHWFRDDRVALSWYLDNHVAPMLTRNHELDTLSAVNAARAWADSAGLGLAMAVSSINAATEPAMRVTWVGTFDELRHGFSSHARYLCTEFWESTFDEGSFRRRFDPNDVFEQQSVISDEHVNAFISMINAFDAQAR